MVTNSSNCYAQTDALDANVQPHIECGSNETRVDVRPSAFVRIAINITVRERFSICSKTVLYDALTDCLVSAESKNRPAYIPILSSRSSKCGLRFSRFLQFRSTPTNRTLCEEL